MGRNFLFLVSATAMFVFSGCSVINSNYSTPSHIESSNTISKARYKATMKPYVRRGKVIQPKEVSVNHTQLGLASWYGPGFHGKKTSSGEYYNMYALTAAHKTLPLGTLVMVENLKTHKSVVVKINDRGPFVANRVIDCSYLAAKKIGLVKDGVAPVKLTVVGKV